jgi:aryl-alcohol dehydrogenase-like predicted oxidoreductase
MQRRKLGYSDLHLTTVGDDAESIAAIRRALDPSINPLTGSGQGLGHGLGINWIDTAAVYGLGHSEEIIGQAILSVGGVSRRLAGRRDEVIIATKCGLVWDEGSTTPYGRLKAESVRREVEASLRRLNVEVIDLYQIHWPNPDEDIEEAWGVIADLIREGKVRYGGVSNFGVEQLERVQAIHPVASLQPPYNMLRRGIEEDLLPYCAANDIGVIVYSPMQSGLLTGKFTKERVANLPDDDWRKRSSRFREPELGANLALVERLRPIAERRR